jgi:hypothetical protein
LLIGPPSIHPRLQKTDLFLQEIAEAAEIRSEMETRAMPAWFA